MYINVHHICAIRKLVRYLIVQDLSRIGGDDDGRKQCLNAATALDRLVFPVLSSALDIDGRVNRLLWKSSFPTF